MEHLRRPDVKGIARMLVHLPPIQGEMGNGSYG